MKCPKCGAEFTGRPDKCPNCGVTLRYAPKANAQKPAPQQPAPEPAPAPAINPFKSYPLIDNRRVWKYVIFNFLTLGIYGIVYMHKWGKDLNRIRAHYGDKERMGFIASFFLSFITLGIPMIIWQVRRISDCYYYARNLGVDKGSATFYFVSWFLLLSWTIICPIISGVQAMRTMNNLCSTLNNL